MPKDHFKSDRHLRLSQQYSSQDMVRDAREIQRIMQRKKLLPKKQPFWQPNTVKAILVALPLSIIWYALSPGWWSGIPMVMTIFVALRAALDNAT